MNVKTDLGKADELVLCHVPVGIKAHHLAPERDSDDRKVPHLLDRLLTGGSRP
jgi:hypothetical protein